MDRESIIALVGGLGMFLLGIHHLTDGLKGLSGDGLRRTLQKLVSGRWSGLLSGAVFTAMTQSSSAAILTVIGFVSAGLVTHSQAVAVVIGANLGTTATTWLVAFFGFKVKIAVAALPMLGAGGFLWLLGKGRIRALGAVLAGFGMLFTGIEYLQTGMAGMEWNLDGVGSGWGGVWILAGIGAVMTVIMQSSSAAGATTLVALAAGTISLEQSFAMVVGQNLGTTATAALAAIGSGLAVRRTVLAHILFNAITGVLVLIFLQPMGEAARWVGMHMGNDKMLTLAAFHTMFNVVGTILFFPWLGRFSRMIEWMTGRGKVSAISRLDQTVSGAGASVAMEAARLAMIEIAANALRNLKLRMAGSAVGVLDVSEDMRRATQFIQGLRFDSTDAQTMPDRRVRLWHALDHLRKLTDLLEDTQQQIKGEELEKVMNAGRDVLEIWLGWAGSPLDADGVSEASGLGEYSRRIAVFRKSRRHELLDQLGEGGAKPEDAMEEMDALRWLDGAFFHTWRMAEYLQAEGAGGVGVETGNSQK